MDDSWTIGDLTLRSRVLLGTARYPSFDVMLNAIEASGTEMVTVALRRVSPTGGSAENLVGLPATVVARHDGHAESLGQAPCRGLVAHRPDGLGRRTDPREADLDHRRGEVCVLGEEAEPGVDGIGAGCDGRPDDGPDIEEIECVRAGRPRHRDTDPETIASPPDPSRDLAAVRDEDVADRGGCPSARGQDLWACGRIRS